MQSSEPPVGAEPEAVRGPQSALSEREIEILQLVATGATNKEIARQLVISPNTVKVHLRNTFSKIGVGSRTEAAMFAIQQGIAEPGTPRSSPTANTSLPAQPAAWQRGWLRYLTAWPIAVLVIALGVGALSWMLFWDRQAAGSDIPDDAGVSSVDRWTSRAALPTARSGLAAVSHNGHIYAVGGRGSEGVTGAFDRYDPSADAWTAMPAKPVPVSDAQAAVIGGQIYLPGGRLASGEPTSLMESFDLREKRWRRRASLPAPVSAYGLVAYEGKLLLFGGWDGETFVSAVYEYDPVQDQWDRRTPMPTARGYVGAAVTSSGVYVVGGQSAQGPVAANELYLPAEDIEGGKPWLSRAPMPEARSAMAVVSIADMVYVIGGKEGEAAMSLLQYFPQRDAWQAQSTPIASPWSHLSAAVLGTEIYGLGGVRDRAQVDDLFSYKAIYTVSIPILPAGE